MAVTKPFDHRGVTFDQAYWRPNHVDQDHVRGEIVFDIEIYATAAARQKTSQVHSRIRTAAINEKTARASRTAAEEKALAVGKANPQQVTPIDPSGKTTRRVTIKPAPAIVGEAYAAAEAARRAHQDAQAEYDDAQQARANVGPVEVHHRGLALEIAAKLIADKATHDEIVAAIYAQEKADGLLLAGGVDA